MRPIDEKLLTSIVDGHYHATVEAVKKGADIFYKKDGKSMLEIAEYLRDLKITQFLKSEMLKKGRFDLV